MNSVSIKRPTFRKIIHWNLNISFLKSNTCNNYIPASFDEVSGISYDKQNSKDISYRNTINQTLLIEIFRNLK